MSISQRPLILVFAVAAAFAFLTHDRETVAQPKQYRGLEMPDVYYLTPRPFEPSPEFIKDDRQLRRLVRDRLSAWTREAGNRPALTAIRTGQSNVKDMLASGRDATADAEARKFLDDYTFPSMTQTDADTLSSLGRKRQQFLKNYLSDKVTGAARASFLDFTVEKLQAYSTNEALHPSARINAVVLLSQLTDRPLAGRDQAPIASAKAFRALLSIFNNTDPKENPDFVKVASLSGIKHQLDLNSKSGQTVDPAVKTQLAETAMKYLTAPANPEENAAAYWNKRQSVQLAGILKDAKTLPALLAILDDETTSLDLKLEVVRAIGKAGAMGTDAKPVLVAICKFAGTSVAGEATSLKNAVSEMERNAMLFGDESLKDTGADFQPADADDLGNGNRNGGFVDSGLEKEVELVELPNYQLANTRNRIRAVAMFCQQAIGDTKQAGLRSNLDAKAETLADGTVKELSSLLVDANVGLIDLDIRNLAKGSNRKRDENLTPQQMDSERKTSYVDQMIKVCEKSAGVLTDQLSSYSTE